MRPIEPIDTILSDRMDPPTLSPMACPACPDTIELLDAGGYRKLFDGVVLRRSPGRVARGGLFEAFVNKSSIMKLEQDISRGFDVSVVPCLTGLNLRAWGVVQDRLGRLFEFASDEEGLLRLNYQGGCCGSRQEWRYLVAKRLLAVAEPVRMFYSQVKTAAGDKIKPAGTMGFGLWDALWMSFDMERAQGFLTKDPDFAKEVFSLWAGYHLDAASAMLDVGIKLILMREHPGGFPALSGIPEWLDVLVGDHYRELARSIHCRGGCLILDCDADIFLETDYASSWGFDGIGPMLFRDEEDLLAARKCLSDRLLLIGSIRNSAGRAVFRRKIRSARGIIMSSGPRADTDAQRRAVPPAEAVRMAG